MRHVRSHMLRSTFADVRYYVSFFRTIHTIESDEARAYGVREGMPGFIAKELCPDIIFTHSNFSAYKKEVGAGTLLSLSRARPPLLLL